MNCELINISIIILEKKEKVVKNNIKLNYFIIYDGWSLRQGYMYLGLLFK